MELRIISGYGKETTEKEHKNFLEEFKKTLIQFGIPVNSITSERLTGGPITLKILEDFDVDEILRSLISFATV
jgi:hypothetical protein